jgi:hypothetical protein
MPDLASFLRTASNLRIEYQEVSNMKRLLVLGEFLRGSAFITPVLATAGDHHDKRY